MGDRAHPDESQIRTSYLIPPYGDGVTEPPEASAEAAQPTPGARTGSAGSDTAPGSTRPADAAGAGPESGAPLPSRPRSVTGRATAAGVIVSALLILAIVLGSRLLVNFDSALLPYAVATVFLAFGVAHRYTV